MKRTPSDWRLVALGLACAAVLCATVALTPTRSAGTEPLLDQVTPDLYRFLSTGDKGALQRARQRVRQVVHKDLLVRSVPGLMRVLDALARTPRSCAPQAGDAFRRGVCLLRRGAYERALIAFAEVSRRQGGAQVRELAARLLALHRSKEQRTPTARSAP